MRLIRNAGTDRVLDIVGPKLADGSSLDLMTPAMSVFGFDAIRDGAGRLTSARQVLPAATVDWGLLGGEADRPPRNQLQVPRLARLMSEWLSAKTEERLADLRNAMSGYAAATPAPADVAST